MAATTGVIGLDAAARGEVGDSVPGLAVIAVDTDGIRIERAFGSADLVRHDEMTSRSVCNWFSMTKLVTATAVVQLADDGRLDLDAPVIDSYPPLTMLRPAERVGAISARHLLAHSSGLANPMPLRWVHPADQPGPDRARFVERLLERHRRVRFAPGAKAAYTNLGYLVLGELVTAVSGETFEDYVHAHVLEPLDMSSTGFTVSEPARWATPYQRRFSALGALMPVLVPRNILGPRHGRFRALRHFYVDGAAYGGLVGPASDAARFLRAHLPTASSTEHASCRPPRRRRCGPSSLRAAGSRSGWDGSDAARCGQRTSWSTSAAAPGSGTACASIPRQGSARS